MWSESASYFYSVYVCVCVCVCTSGAKHFNILHGKVLSILYKIYIVFYFIMRVYMCVYTPHIQHRVARKLLSELTAQRFSIKYTLLLWRRRRQ